MDWIPTIEAARREGLTVVLDPPGLLRGPRDVLAVEPTRVAREAAVIVTGSSVRRTRATLRAARPPRLAGLHLQRGQEPGLETPLPANGVSLFLGAAEERPCDACAGATPAACPKCLGDGRLVTVEQLYVTEERARFHNVYTPRDLPLALDDVVQARLGGAFAVPGELEWHGELAGTQGGYRHAARDPGTVLGFSLGAALGAAERFAAHASDGADAFTARTFGWPLLRLFYAGVGQALLLVTPAGALEAFGHAATRDD